jgi:glucitol/sorbitol PTS system EIIB component
VLPISLMLRRVAHISDGPAHSCRSFLGTQIATGALPVQYALPTLFAIDGQVGCDFIPVGLGLGEAKVETVEVGTPAVLFSRMFTSPLAVVIAWAASFGL